jgi:hypothetical protein
VAIDGVCIGNRKYWTLTERKYKWIRQSHRVTHSKNHCNYSTHEVFSFFTSRCLVAASNGVHSSFCGFPSCPRPQLLNSRNSNSQFLNHNCTIPRYVAPARMAQKTCTLVSKETCPQSCSLATAVVLLPVYTAVTGQWIYMSQYIKKKSFLKLWTGLNLLYIRSGGMFLGRNIRRK